MNRFYWKPEKNEWLEEERSISFEEVEAAIASGGLVDIQEYVGTKSIHKGQKILVVSIDGELWKVPVTVTKTGIFMRTVYPAEEES